MDTFAKHGGCSPLWLEVKAAQQPLSEDKPLWCVAVTLKNEPNHMYLKPWVIHGLLTAALEATHALTLPEEAIVERQRLETYISLEPSAVAGTEEDVPIIAKVHMQLRLHADPKQVFC